MQTFLPYSDFSFSIRALDDRRLGKQRVEAYQILRTLTGASQGWKNHPAVKMWRGYEDALGVYMNCCIIEWIQRGFKNTMKLHSGWASAIYPPWLGDPAFHRSHQSNLIRKMPERYGPMFPGVPADLPYVWPA